MLLTILGACYWQHWAAAVAAAAYDTAAPWASWALSQDYQWVNDLLQQIHLPSEVLSDSVQQFSGTVGVESEHTLTLTAQAILTLRAEASPLQAGYEYLLGVVAVTTAWSFLQAASLAAGWYHSATKRAYRRHFSDRRTRQITRAKPMQVHRWAPLMGSTARCKHWRCALLLMFLLPQEAAGLARQATSAGFTSVGQAGQELWQYEWSVTFWSYLTLASLTTLAVLMLLTLLAAKLYDRLTMQWHAQA